MDWSLVRVRNPHCDVCTVSRITADRDQHPPDMSVKPPRSHHSEDLVLYDWVHQGKRLYGAFELFSRLCSDNLPPCHVLETAAPDSFPSYSFSVCRMIGAVPSTPELLRAA